MQSESYNTSVEVLGEAILIFKELLNIHRPEALQILEKHGFKEPRNGEWYSQKTWLEAFKEIASNLGPTTTYVLGTKILDNIQWPPEVDELQNGLSSIDEQYQKHHRNGKIGGYDLIVFDKEKRQAKIMSNTPYPCDFERGIIMAILMQFNLDPRKLWVVHEDPYQCRKRNSDRCTYIIRW